jgi:hypothetical protein
MKKRARPVVSKPFVVKGVTSLRERGNNCTTKDL